jgi:hypothetical protein
LVDVICDTSFLIHLATRKISNLDSINTEIGQIQLVVPTVVLNELKRLANVESKKQDAMTTLEFAQNLKSISISGEFADKEITEYVKKYGGMVATMDKELKLNIKNLGGSILSFSNDKIVLES